MTLFGVVISKSGNDGYQFFVGWDMTFTSRAEAQKLWEDANNRFCGARIVSASEAEAKRLGWRLPERLENQ